MFLRWFIIFKYLKHGLLSLVGFSVLCLILYLIAFDQIAKLESDSDDPVIIGRVVQAETMKGPNDLYLVEDPTGKVYVKTQKGTPRVNAMMVVFGTGVKKTPSGYTMMTEKKRLGTF